MMRMTQRQSFRTLTQLILFARCLMILRSFHAGVAINPIKTEGIWIGSLRETKTKPFGIKWPNEANKALGVSYSYDQNFLHKKNYIKIGQR